MLGLTLQQTLTRHSIGRWQVKVGHATKTELCKDLEELEPKLLAQGLAITT